MTVKDYEYLEFLRNPHLITNHETLNTSVRKKQ